MCWSCFPRQLEIPINKTDRARGHGQSENKWKGRNRNVEKLTEHSWRKRSVKMYIPVLKTTKKKCYWPGVNPQICVCFVFIIRADKIPVPLVRRRSLMETLWVESEAPEARPVFPPSSLFSLLANVSMAALLWSASVCPLLHCAAKKPDNQKEHREYISQWRTKGVGGGTQRVSIIISISLLAYSLTTKTCTQGKLWNLHFKLYWISFCRPSGVDHRCIKTTGYSVRGRARSFQRKIRSGKLM